MSQLAAVVAVVLAAVSLAACGSSSNRSSSSRTSSPSATAASANSEVAAAKAAIAPYTGHSTPFPVSTPLSKPVPAGTKIAFLECGTPACGLVAKLLAPAVKTLGAKMEIVNAGDTAQTNQAAAASVLSLHPSAVLLTGIQPSIFGGALKKLSAAGIKVVSISNTQNVKPFGISFNYVGLQQTLGAAKLLADWVIANKGPKSNVVFYGVPDISFSNPMQAAFEKELHSKCPTCQVRTTEIDATTLGTTAAQTVVSDLQAHPGTNVAVFASAEIESGLPSALKSAGLSITTLGYAPEPEQLQGIKAGQLTAGFAVDFPVSVWTGVDAAARLIVGDKLTPDEIAGEIPEEFLDRKSITFNPANGWTGYPNFAKTFAKLWHPAS